MKTLLEGQTLHNQQIKPGWRVSTVIKIHSAFTKQHKIMARSTFCPGNTFICDSSGAFFLQYSLNEVRLWVRDFYILLHWVF